MNLTDLKNQFKTVRAPTTISAHCQNGLQAMNDLIGNIRAQETRETEQLRSARPLWLIAAGLFTFVFLMALAAQPTGITPARLWLSGVLAAVYLLNAALLARKLRRLRQVDYTEPVHAFLEKAERRLQFMLPAERWLVGCGLLILGVMAGFYVADTLIQRHLAPDQRPFGLAFYCASYLALCAAAMLLTYKKWKRTKAPLLRDLQQLKNALTLEEA